MSERDIASGPSGPKLRDAQPQSKRQKLLRDAMPEPNCAATCPLIQPAQTEPTCPALPQTIASVFQGVDSILRI